MIKPNHHSKPRKLNRGVMFGEDVLQYLAEIERDWGCSRSYLVNHIIRTHAVITGSAGAVSNVERVVCPVIRM